MRSPVLLLVFNRPEATSRVFQSIRQAAPPRLYVSGNAAPASTGGEAESMRRVQEIATAVDWPCEVATRCLSQSPSRKYAAISALNWFFTSEPEGIVLEDDCLPHMDFFRYCDWALAAYRDDTRVFHVNGNNFGAPRRIFGDRLIAFTPLAQVWGWASWADRWRHFEGNPFYLDTTRFQQWPLSQRARWQKRHHADLLQQGVDTWVYQWQIAVLAANGLCISSRANLITKIGDGESMTRTKRDSDICLPLQQLDGELAHYVPRTNRALTRWYERRMGLTSVSRFARIVGARAVAVFRFGLDRIAARILFGWSQPIVVASTGRAGSTLLFRAIVEGLTAHRFGKTCSKRLPAYVLNRAGAFVARLADIKQTPNPVLKTHDLYDPQYSGKAKFIFVYGDPLESALSAASMVDKNGRIWLDEHLFHLSAKGEYEDLFRSDLLNFGDQMLAWSRADPKDVLIVSFGELWDSVPAISAFVGFDVSLPARRRRTPKRLSAEIDEKVFARLREDATAYVAGRQSSTVA